MSHVNPSYSLVAALKGSVLPHVSCLFNLWKHSVWSKLEFVGTSNWGLVIAVGRQTVHGYVIISLNLITALLKQRLRTMIDLKSVHPPSPCYLATSPHFRVKKQLIFYSPRHLRRSLTFHHYTFQMCARRKMATPGHPSSLRSEHALKTLGSKPCQWQSKRRQDITDLKPQAIYENPLRLRVWVSLLSETSKGFSIKTM